jgi:hypothetical protein
LFELSNAAAIYCDSPDSKSASVPNEIVLELRVPTRAEPLLDPPEFLYATTDLLFVES